MVLSHRHIVREAVVEEAVASAVVLPPPQSPSSKVYLSLWLCFVVVVLRAVNERALEYCTSLFRACVFCILVSFLCHFIAKVVCGICA